MQNAQVQAFLNIAQTLCCTVFEQEPLAQHTSFRIGGPARLFVEVKEEEALKVLWLFCKEHRIPVFLLGNGSNLLVPDEGFDGVILHLSGIFEQCRCKENQLTAGAGMKLSGLARFAREKGLAGMEFAYGIPGSVGGAVFMNAGAYGGEMKDIVVSVRCLSPAGAVCEVPASDLNFGYRHSLFSEKEGVILAVTIQLTPDFPEKIGIRMEEFMRKRREKQPLELPSAGSMFKRPAGHYAAALIEECGLKGFSVGGAQVSRKHSGFVVNTGGATCAQVCELVRQVQEVVWEKTGVRLEREVRLLGEESFCSNEG